MNRLKLNTKRALLWSTYMTNLYVLVEARNHYDVTLLYPLLKFGGRIKGVQTYKLKG
jgi:hypothetical protein